MSSNKWALLIGIDEYVEGTASRLDTRDLPINYDPLRGCVADVLQVEGYLIHHMDVCKEHIRKLITRPWDRELPAECCNTSDELPTYANIIGAMDWVLHAAQIGDLVYIHYSGHGAQATTVFPMLKGEAGIDEALVPTDINTEGGKYVRDIELTLWLGKMVAKGLIVTVVLDSCHSASATRGSGQVAFRGIPQTYKSTDHDKPTAVLMDQVKSRSSVDGTADSYEGSRVKDSWLLEPQGYTLLAACRPRESAREYETRGEYQGALTYWLLDTLRKCPQVAASTKTLYQRLFGKIQSLFSDQTPVIGGTTDRAFFGADVLPSVNAIVVRKVNEGQELELAAGSLHSVRKGAKYALYPSTGDIDPSSNEAGPMLATITVKEVSPVSSIATLTEVRDVEDIEPGCRAVLLGVPDDDRFLVALPSSSNAEVTQKMTGIWDKQPDKYKAWLKLVSDDDLGLPTFRIAINSSSCFEIQDGDGVVWPNVAPPLPSLSVENNVSIEKIMYRLKHLALFNMFKNLENDNEVSAMRGALLLDVLGKSRDGTVNFLPSNLASVEDQQGIFVAQHEDILFVRVKNVSRKEKTVNIAVFDLQPLHGIQMIYPPGGEFETLDQGQELVFPLSMTFPAANIGSSSVIDTFKVLASPQPIFVSAMQLDDLHVAENKGLRSSSNATNQMQCLLNKFIKPQRNGRVPTLVAERWGTEQLIIRTLREGAST